MHFINLVALIALIQYMSFGLAVGKQRGVSGIKAPAISGHDGLERAMRVQMNTLECLVAYLPALYIAATYWSPMIIAPIGVVFIIGRALYNRAYMSNPSSRTIGFMLSFLPIVVLLALSLIGAVLAVL